MKLSVKSRLHSEPKLHRNSKTAVDKLGIKKFELQKNHSASNYGLERSEYCWAFFWFISAEPLE